MNQTTDIAIVGGGVAGLGAAIALAPCGARIAVIEKRKHTGGIHRGDSLLPKATALLTQWGLRDALDRAGATPIDRMEVHGGDFVYRAPLTPPGATHPYLVLPHARLEAALMERAMSLPNVQVIRPATFAGLIRDPGGDRVSGVQFRSGDHGHALACRLLVAADGQHSRVRKALEIGFPAIGYDHAYFGVEAERPAAYGDAMRIHFHEDGGVLLMPHPQRIGVGVLVPAGSARRWLNLDAATLSAELVRRAPVLRGAALHLDAAHFYELTRAHAQRYAAPGAVLIGDAAHCTNPTAGQGMAMALTDAGALARILGSGWSSAPAAIDRLLHDYERAQWSANDRLVQRAHRLARLYALRGPRWMQIKLWGVRALAWRGMRHLTAPLLSGFLQEEGVTA
jgi:2-polyprenyl-6-methoxyphenol hydroxylase-like FAD-dependent oxidoreductase